MRDFGRLEDDVDVESFFPLLRKKRRKMANMLRRPPDDFEGTVSEDSGGGGRTRLMEPGFGDPEIQRTEEDEFDGITVEPDEDRTSQRAFLDGAREDGRKQMASDPRYWRFQLDGKDSRRHERGPGHVEVELDYLAMSYPEAFAYGWRHNFGESMSQSIVDTLKLIGDKETQDVLKALMGEAVAQTGSSIFMPKSVRYGGMMRPVNEDYLTSTLPGRGEKYKGMKDLSPNLVALFDFLGAQYGTEEGRKKYLATDPVGFLGDALIFTAIGSAGLSVSGKVSIPAKLASKISFMNKGANQFWQKVRRGNKLQRSDVVDQGGVSARTEVGTRSGTDLAVRAEDAVTQVHELVEDAGSLNGLTLNLEAIGHNLRKISDTLQLVMDPAGEVIGVVGVKVFSEASERFTRLWSRADIEDMGDDWATQIKNWDEDDGIFYRITPLDEIDNDNSWAWVGSDSIFESVEREVRQQHGLSRGDDGFEEAFNQVLRDKYHMTEDPFDFSGMNESEIDGMSDQNVLPPSNYRYLGLNGNSRIDDLADWEMGWDWVERRARGRDLNDPGATMVIQVVEGNHLGFTIGVDGEVFVPGRTIAVFDPSVLENYGTDVAALERYTEYNTRVNDLLRDRGIDPDDFRARSEAMGDGSPVLHSDIDGTDIEARVYANPADLDSEDSLAEWFLSINSDRNRALWEQAGRPELVAIGNYRYVLGSDGRPMNISIVDGNDFRSVTVEIDLSPAGQRAFAEYEKAERLWNDSGLEPGDLPETGDSVADVDSYPDASVEGDDDSGLIVTDGFDDSPGRARGSASRSDSSSLALKRTSEPRGPNVETFETYDQLPEGHRLQEWGFASREYWEERLPEGTVLIADGDDRYLRDPNNGVTRLVRVVNHRGIADRPEGLPDELTGVTMHDDFRNAVDEARIRSGLQGSSERRSGSQGASADERRSVSQGSGERRSVSQGASADERRWLSEGVTRRSTLVIHDHLSGDADNFVILDNLSLIELRDYLQEHGFEGLRGAIDRNEVGGGDVVAIDLFAEFLENNGFGGDELAHYLDETSGGMSWRERSESQDRGSVPDDDDSDLIVTSGFNDTPGGARRYADPADLDSENRLNEWLFFDNRADWEEWGSPELVEIGSFRYVVDSGEPVAFSVVDGGESRYIHPDAELEDAIRLWNESEFSSEDLSSEDYVSTNLDWNQPEDSSSADDVTANLQAEEDQISLQTMSASEDDVRFQGELEEINAEFGDDMAVTPAFWNAQREVIRASTNMGTGRWSLGNAGGLFTPERPEFVDLILEWNVTPFEWDRNRRPPLVYDGTDRYLYENGRLRLVGEGRSMPTLEQQSGLFAQNDVDIDRLREEAIRDPLEDLSGYAPWEISGFTRHSGRDSIPASRLSEWLYFNNWDDWQAMGGHDLVEIGPYRYVLDPSDQYRPVSFFEDGQTRTLGPDLFRGSVHAYNDLLLNGDVGAGLPRVEALTSATLRRTSMPRGPNVESFTMASQLTEGHAVDQWGLLSTEHWEEAFPGGTVLVANGPDRYLYHPNSGVTRLVRVLDDAGIPNEPADLPANLSNVDLHDDFRSAVDLEIWNNYPANASPVDVGSPPNVQGQGVPRTYSDIDNLSVEDRLGEWLLSDTDWEQSGSPSLAEIGRYRYVMDLQFGIYRPVSIVEGGEARLLTIDDNEFSDAMILYNENRDVLHGGAATGTGSSTGVDNSIAPRSDADRDPSLNEDVLEGLPGAGSESGGDNPRAFRDMLEGRTDNVSVDLTTEQILNGIADELEIDSLEVELALGGIGVDLDQKIRDTDIAELMDEVVAILGLDRPPRDIDPNDPSSLLFRSESHYRGLLGGRGRGRRRR